MSALAKVLRFIKIYGLGKTWFKVMGRARISMRFLLPRSSKLGSDVGVIGCGQFAFATIGYSLCRKFGNRFVDCYDITPVQKQSFADYYKISSPSQNGTELIANTNVRFVYVASNHASHTDYAIEAIKAGKTVYIEKPISVTHGQLTRLVRATRQVDRPVYAGYNRPFSLAIRQLKNYVGERKSPITLSCCISGHMLAQDHWYRKPKEGTRICGNVGHWLDLAVHILSWGELPDNWDINLAYSNPSERDDNMSISMTSSEEDLVVIVLTSRCEPFEGINETINFQHANTICKIDDFRRMTIWQDEKLIRKRYWPKDVGHGLAILQPFQDDVKRDWNEVVYSTLLMLHITDMLRKEERASSFSFQESLLQLEADVTKEYDENGHIH